MSKSICYICAATIHGGCDTNMVSYSAMKCSKCWPVYGDNSTYRRAFLWAFRIPLFMFLSKDDYCEEFRRRLLK